MNALDADPTADELAAALRRQAVGSYTHTAAVELLIAHRHWLLREAFRGLTEWWPADDSGPAAAAPDWQSLDGMGLRLTLPDTDSEIGVLSIACSIANGWLGDALSSCDPTNIDLIVDAIYSAAGGGAW